MSNRNSSAGFGASDIRAYIVNNRIEVFDQNTAEIRKDLSFNSSRLLVYDASVTEAINNISLSGATVSISGGYIGITGPVSISGGSVSVSNFPAAFSVSGPVSLATGSFVGITGGITGNVSVSNFPAAFSVSGPVSLATGSLIGITGGITGNVNVDNFPAAFSVSGPVSLATGSLIGITGDISGSVNVNNFPASFGITGGITGTVSVSGTVQTNDASANASLVTIQTDISSGILVKGQDDTGVRYPIYTDANGVQRTEVVTGHIETSKYVFDTDVALITGTGIGWSLDARGRKGWYRESGYGSDTLNWYANSISAPPSLYFNKAQAIWFNAVHDVTSSVCSMIVQTTLSVWAYTISNPTTTLINGEAYCFYYGTKAINLNPSYHPILLSRVLVSGPGGNAEPLTDITINTSSQCLVIGAGVWNQTLSQQYSVLFDDILDKQEQDKIISLQVDSGLLKTGVYSNIPGTSTIQRVNVASQSYQALPGSRIAIATDSLTRASTVSASVNPSYPGMSTVTAEVTSTDVFGVTGLNRVSLATLVDNPISYPVNSKLTGFDNYVSVTGPVSLASGTKIEISGNVATTTTIAAGSYVGITGQPIGVTGYVNVGNWPVDQTVTVSGPISLSNGTKVEISGNVATTTTIAAGSYVGITGQPIGVTGYVNVGNWPTNQIVTVSGPISLASGTSVGLVAGTKVEISGNISASIAPGTAVTVSGPISLATGTYVGITGQPIGITGAISILPNQTVGVTGLGTTNFQNTFGLNSYTIYPKKKMYNFSAITTSTTFNASIGAFNNYVITAYDFGVTKPKNWYFGNVATGFSYTCSYEYIDGSGNTGTASTGSVANNAWSAALSPAGNIISINKFTVTASSTSTNSVNAGNLYFAHTAANTTGAMCTAGSAYDMNSLFTVPKNSIAWVENCNMTFSAAEFPRLVKWDATTGARTILYHWNSVSSVANTGSGVDAGLGGIAYPGETLGWFSTGNSASRVIFANIVVQEY